MPLSFRALSSFGSPDPILALPACGLLLTCQCNSPATNNQVCWLLESLQIACRAHPDLCELSWSRQYISEVLGMMLISARRDEVTVDRPEVGKNCE